MKYSQTYKAQGHAKWKYNQICPYHPQLMTLAGWWALTQLSMPRNPFISAQMMGTR